MQKEKKKMDLCITRKRINLFSLLNYSELALKNSTIQVSWYTVRTGFLIRSQKRLF